MSYAPSYNNDRSSTGNVAEVEYPADPASGGFFQSDYKKHDDLKQMLDGSKDSLKLEAMKRIIGMVAKGRDASDLFPAVVKNVVSKNIEVKKLVYVYLERYAEEQQDLALLSISTFQRALKDPNQLIRASALRVLSSIRVEMIVPIVMLAIKDSVSDMSPYVRKTAAHAIPKLYSLDPELKEELVSIIKKLLSERTTIVIGSAVMAFSEVCPERSDLIHPNFRKLCTLLIDVDEWGQLVILNVLTRYARENFCDPNSGDGARYEDENERPFYDSDDVANSDDSDEEINDDKLKNLKKVSSKKKSQTNTNTLDPDHRLLLRSANPLLQSRNAGVVMSVAQLYYHAGPASDLPQAARALIRLLRSPIEVQSIVLHSIASLTIGKKNMFEPFLKTFFVRTSDPTHIKILKLEILSNLATEGTVPTILREFQTYITSSDKSFVAATIQAIDRCAANIKTVTDTCLQGLLDLLSNKDESIVAESVVVIKKLLQSERSVDHKTIIAQMVRLLDHITVGAARAAILWLLGEYRSDRIAPDVLRKCAKTFVQEEDLVKLQVLNLAVKLCLTNPNQTQLLAQYIFTLARYDPSYDIRDRARFLKHFVFPANANTSKLLQNAEKIFLATKPAPLLESKFKERQQYTLGSLSHYVSGRASGYMPLPQFPLESSPSSLRDTSKTESSDSLHRNIYGEKNVNKLFYSESEESSPAASSSENESSDENNVGSERETNNSESEGKKSKASKKSNDVDSSSSNYDSDSSNSDSSNSECESDDSDSEISESDTESNEPSSETCSKSENECENKNIASNDEVIKNASSDLKEKTNLDLLLELGEIGDALPIMTPTYGGFLSPVVNNQSVVEDSITLVSPSFIPLRSYELLSKIAGHGLMILYRFTRSPHLFSSKMASLELLFVNQSNEEISNISVNKKGLSADQSIHQFAPISSLGIGCSQSGILGIDFNDTSQSAQFFIKSDLGESSVSIKPPVGELVRSVSMSESRFLIEQKKLRGMTQVEGQIECTDSPSVICQKLVDLANLSPITSQDNVLRFAGQTLSTQCILLLSIQLLTGRINITVNCEKMVIGSMLLNEVKAHLSKQTSTINN